jgi:hypothetical protein
MASAEDSKALKAAQDAVAGLLGAQPVGVKKAVEKYQQDYETFLKTGNLAQGRPTFPFPPQSSEMEVNPLADALQAWERKARDISVAEKDKAQADAKAAQQAAAKAASPLFTLTNPPTKDEAIAAIVAMTKDTNQQTGLRNAYSQMASATEIMMHYATNTKSTTLPTQGGVPLTLPEAQKLGAILLHTEKAREKATGTEVKRPEAVLIGSDDRRYTLEAKELSAYLQTANKNGTLQSVDAWAKEKGIAFTNHGKEYSNGRVGGFLNFGETLYIETPEGQRRTFGNGGITEPLQGGHYGAIEGLKVGDKDDLDIYVSDKIFEQIAAGNKYEGRVFVMQQMSGGKPDELKIGFAETRDEFRRMQASTWNPQTDFGKRNEGAYVELTYEQWKVLKEDIAKKPDLTLEQFVAAHPEMRLTVTPKAKLDYIRELDGPTSKQVDDHKTALTQLRANVFAATDGIGTPADQTEAKTAQPALVNKAKLTHGGATLGATAEQSAQFVEAFVKDVTAKTKASVAANTALEAAAKSGRDDAALKPLQEAAIAARQAALGENETLAKSAELINTLTSTAKQAGAAERQAAAQQAQQAQQTAASQAAAEAAKIVVEEKTIRVKDGISQTLKDQAKDVVTKIKTAMENAGMKGVTDKDAAFVAAAMVASENDLTNANKVTKGQTLTFSFTQGEIDSAIATVKNQTQDGKKPADLYKAGELNPIPIVGKMTREQTASR